MMAAMPLLFAIQQAAEGVVWLTVGSAAHPLLHQLAVYLFLSFALAIWPSWLPWSLLMIEEDADRRRWLRRLVGVGAAVSLYAAWLLLTWRPTAHVAGHSIGYHYQVSDWLVPQVGYLVLYVVPTVVPFFVSTVALTRWMGIVLLLGLVATMAIKRGALTSVWCFFAAILSTLFVLAVTRERRVLTPAPA
jgi:hypothetical protein